MLVNIRTYPRKIFDLILSFKDAFPDLFISNYYCIIEVDVLNILEMEVNLMPEEFKPGCQRPSVKKPVEANKDEVVEKREEKSMIKVGGKAPEFTAPAFFQGKFVNTSLSEYQGKWVLLCFYPGDFTFV